MKEVLSFLLTILILIIGVGLSLIVLYNVAFNGFPGLIGVGMMFTLLGAISIGAELVND